MKNTINEKQFRLNAEFFESCKNSDLENIKKLCETTHQYEEKLNSKFSFFFKLINWSTPKVLKTATVDFFADDCGGLITLANKGDINTLSYIVSSPLFQKQLAEADQRMRYRFADTFFNAASLGHMNCVQLLAPLIDHERIYFHTFERFVDACSMGDLNTVKFLTTTNLLQHNASYMINGAYSDIRNTEAEGFVNACEGGHLDIVKYLTSDPSLIERVNLDFINEPIHIEERSIMEYFVFDLNLPENSRFLRLAIDFDILDELLEKRRMFEDLSYELDHNQEQPNKKVNKI